MSDDTIHPRQAEAQAKAAQVALNRRAAAEIVALAHDQGIRFVEVDPQTSSMEFTSKPPKSGRLTIAFAEERRNIVNIATAICHPNDKFDKRIGRATAALNLLNGQFIQLRKPTSFFGSTKRWLNQTFTQYGQ
jgi:hypothetical protein